MADLYSVRAIDVRDPENLAEIGALSLPGRVIGLAQGEGYLYAFAQEAGMYVLRTSGAVEPTATPSRTPTASPFPGRVWLAYLPLIVR